MIAVCDLGKKVGTGLGRKRKSGHRHYREV